MSTIFQDLPDVLNLLNDVAAPFEVEWRHDAVKSSGFKLGHKKVFWIVMKDFL